MLRASCKTSQVSLDIKVVIDHEVPCGIRHYQELLAFADALLRQDGPALDHARSTLRREAGDAAVVRAAAVVGNFQMMNRALDALGAQFGAQMRPLMAPLAGELGRELPAHWD